MSISKDIQHRMLARMRYRRRRDRKIAVDYLGKWFEIKYTSPLPNTAVEWIKVQMVGYDHLSQSVVFHSPSTIPTTVKFPSDEFWSGYRTGIIRDAA